MGRVLLLWLSLLVLVLMSVATTLPRSTLLAGGEATLVFSLEDPQEDDVGPGTYVYPTASVFVPGVFDLRGFEVYETETSVMFKIRLRNLGGNPWDGPNGFSLQFLHVFVKTEIEEGLNDSAFGLNVKIVPGWHFALLLAPGWGDEPVPYGERAALYYANGTCVTQNGGFNVTVLPDIIAIVATVSKSLLPSHAVSKWGYAVLLAGYDGHGYMRVRGVVPGNATEWNFGGADPYAVEAGVEPRVIDLLAPTAEEQYSMLTSYNPETRDLAKVSIYVAGPPLPTIITPSVITVTLTDTKTITITETTTKTVTSISVTSVTLPTPSPTTITETTHTTVTSISVTSVTVPTLSPITETTKLTTTVVETVVPAELTYGFAGVVVALLAAIAFLLIRRPGPR